MKTQTHMPLVYKTIPLNDTTGENVLITLALLFAALAAVIAIA